MCKVHTSFHEITNEPYVSSNYENTTKSAAADLTKTTLLRPTPHMLKKSRRLVKTASKWPNSELDKDTVRSKLK